MRGRRGSVTGPTSSSSRYSVARRPSRRSVYGDASTNAACDGTVSGSPRTHRNSASDGPAPPRRPSSASGSESTTRTPSDCSSTSSVRSSRSRRSGMRSEGLLVVLPEHAVLELLRDVADPVELPVLAVEVRPGLVGAEEDAVAADAGALDLGQQPARAEADRPRRVGVDLVAVLHPLQELGHEPDVARHAAAEVHQVDLAALAIGLDERDEVVDVGVAARRGVEVEHQVVLLADVEALVGQGLRLVVPGARVRVAAEQERRLQRHDARLARQLERLARELGVAGQERHPDRRQDAVVRRRRVHHDVVEVERQLVDRHAVVGHRERPLDLEEVHVLLHEVLRRGVVVDRRLHGVLEVVELPRRDLADVAVRVDDLLRVRSHGQPLPNRSRAWAIRASHSSRVSKVCAGITGGLSSSQAPSAGSSCTTSSVNVGRPTSSGSSEDACIARPPATCISSRCEPSGVTSSNRTTQSAPSRLARSSRSRARALPCSRVTSRWRWQKAASRTASRSISASIGGAEPATASLTMSERSFQAVTRSSSVCTSRSSPAIARTTSMYCWYSVALTITVG